MPEMLQLKTTNRLLVPLSYTNSSGSKILESSFYPCQNSLNKTYSPSPDDEFCGMIGQLNNDTNNLFVLPYAFEHNVVANLAILEDVAQYSYLTLRFGATPLINGSDNRSLSILSPSGDQSFVYGDIELQTMAQNYGSIIDLTCQAPPSTHYIESNWTAIGFVALEGLSDWSSPSEVRHAFVLKRYGFNANVTLSRVAITIVSGQNVNGLSFSRGFDDANYTVSDTPGIKSYGNLLCAVRPYTGSMDPSRTRTIAQEEITIARQGIVRDCTAASSRDLSSVFIAR